METRKIDLEDRLIDFTIMVSDVIESLPNTKLANHLGSQGIGSPTTPALLYGEVQSAESQRDFIHKAQIRSKELRETKVCLKIILGKRLLIDSEVLPALNENEELIAIFAKSIITAKSKLPQ